MPLSVGVVIPIFNGSEYIDATLASVAAQFCPPDQVVVVDDGSTDASAKRAEAWIDILPVRVLRLERNAGPGAARNVGIDACSTDLIALVDADDVLLPDHLSTCISLQNQRGGFVIGDCVNWLPGKAIGTRSWFERLPLPPTEAQYRSFVVGNRLTITSVFAKADFLSIGPFDESSRVEDWDFWVRVARAEINISAPDHPTWLYRQVENNRSKGLSIVEGQLEALTTILENAGESDSKFGRKTISEATRRVDLYRSYDHARAGNRGLARSEAKAAMHGEKRDAMRALLMWLVPIYTVRIYDKLRMRPKHQVR